MGAFLAAQTVSTEILGQVRDPSGAAVPGAIVTAKRGAAGDNRTARTNEAGLYLFALVEPGEYEISCGAPGFKTALRRDVVLQLQQKARVDFQLQIGDQVETVEVAGAAPLLHTEDAALGLVIEGKRLVDLPINGRNFAHLAALMPGVILGGSRMGLDGMGGQILGQTIAIAANGQRDVAQQITLDGVIATEPRVNTMLFTPSVEAIAEFRVQTATYSAEYGMNSGAQVQVAIRSGANALHGTVFEFLRNDRLDARGFFLPAGQPKNRLRRNQFGAVVSGPLARNRTFWLGNWEARRERRGTPALLRVPTPAMREGDFSEILTPGNRWYPQVPNPAATNQIRVPGGAAPFPDNVIPPSLIHRIARNLLTATKGSPLPEGGFLRLPNLEAQARAQNRAENLGGTSDLGVDSDQFLGRLDHQFSERDRVFGRYILQDTTQASTPLARVNRGVLQARAQNLAIGWARHLGATALNDFRYGYNRAASSDTALFTNTEFTQRDLGLDFRVVGDGNRTLRKDEEGLPSINILGFTGIGDGNAGTDVHQVHHLADSLILSRGKHNLKLGGEYRYNFLDRAISGSRGTLTFNRQIQGIPDAFAAFLLGYPDSTATAQGAPPLFARQNRFGIYFQDDWKVAPRLSLNLGLRYDLFTSVQDVQGKFRNLDFSRAARLGGEFAPMLWPDPNVQAALYDIPYLQIMPRVGLAWQARSALVVRAGAGQFYNVQQMNNFSILNLQPPFSGSTQYLNDRMNPRATLDNPFAGSPVSQPAALITLGNLQSNGRSRYLNNDTWQWTLEVEKAFGASLVGALAYVGSKSSNVDVTIANFNHPDPGPGNIDARRPLRFYVDSREPGRLLPLGTVRRLDTSENASYHALQARAERRHSRGLTLVASYAFQKWIAVGYGANEAAAFTVAPPQDPRNLRGSRGRAALDQRHRIVASYVYEIPLRRQRQGVAAGLVGGWSLTGSVQLASGFPFTVLQSGDLHNTGFSTGARPHLVSGQSLEPERRSIDRWFNPAAFRPSVLEYGNAGVNLFDAPARKEWVFGLFKDFRVREGHRLQLRYEAFNFLNTPQFSAPERSLGNPSFGRVTSTLANNREMQFGLKYLF